MQTMQNMQKTVIKGRMACNNEFPFIAATIHARVTNEDGVENILLFINLKSRDRVLARRLITFNNNELSINRASEEYCQIQSHLAITRVLSCTDVF